MSCVYINAGDEGGQTERESLHKNEKKLESNCRLLLVI